MERDMVQRVLVVAASSACLIVASLLLIGLASIAKEATREAPRRWKFVPWTVFVCVVVCLVSLAGLIVIAKTGG